MSVQFLGVNRTKMFLYSRTINAAKFFFNNENVKKDYCIDSEKNNLIKTTK